MDTAYISAASALAGSVIGGLMSALTTWLSQREQAKVMHIAHRLERREELYKDFIDTASKVYADALMHSEPQIKELVALYAMLSRMRILSRSYTVACAERVLRLTTETYSQPNKTHEQLQELVKSDAVDPLREFSEAARDELRSLPLL